MCCTAGYDVLKEALLKRADVPLSVTTSSERSTLAEDLLAAGLDTPSPSVIVTPATTANTGLGGPISPAVQELFAAGVGLAELDGKRSYVGL